METTPVRGMDVCNHGSALFEEFIEVKYPFDSIRRVFDVILSTKRHIHKSLTVL